ncbi:Insulinase (Peptidase family M16) family protein [Cryptosporidium felis]|nr:Insulinase (Peptidase family M16) family protein [Cryptosporidium felis]
MEVTRRDPRVLEVVEDSRFEKSEGCSFKCKFQKMSNGLENFLVSCEKLSGTSINLVVKVGSAMEGREVDGLAHFLEHSLFLGTERFPGQNEFGRFVRSHGGGTNAATDVTMTHYSVSIPNQFLEETLDRFSQFFKSPLFPKEYLSKEINIIDGEFLSKTNHYVTILEHVLKQLSDEDHIYRKFYYGNSETLLTDPEKKGISLRERAIQFFSNYYGSGNMTLVIFSSLELEVISELSLKYFSDVKSALKPPPSPESLSKYSEFPFKGMARRLAKINLNTDRRELVFLFPLPRKEFGISRSFCMYLSFLFSPISGQGQMETLIQRELCFDISLNEVYSQLGFSYLTISLFLTIQGASSLRKVILAVFLAIQTIKKTPFIEEYVRRIACRDQSEFREIQENLASVQLLDLLNCFHQTKSPAERFFSACLHKGHLSEENFKELMGHLNSEKLVLFAIGSGFDLEPLWKNGLILESNHPSYKKGKNRVKECISKFIPSGKVLFPEAKCLLSEKHFRTRYSIWDLSQLLISEIDQVKAESGLDFSNPVLPQQAFSLLEFRNPCLEATFKLDPPILLDIACEFEKLRPSKWRSLAISNKMKITSFWKGMFYLFVPERAFPNSLLIFRLVIPPLFGKKSANLFSLKGFYIKNVFHSMALIQLLLELSRLGINLNMESLSREGVNFQIYPTFKSSFPSFSIGIECYILGKPFSISNLLFEFAKSLKSISKLSREQFEVAKSAAVVKQTKIQSQLTYAELSKEVELRVLSSGSVDSDTFIKFIEKAKLEEILAVSKFFRKNCLFEGIFVGAIQPSSLKTVFTEFATSLREENSEQLSRSLIFVRDSPNSDYFRKPYYNQIFFIQNKESNLYFKGESQQNSFHLIDLFSIPPDKNRIYFLSSNPKVKHNLIRLSIFFKKETITAFKLQILNQIFFDTLFEYIRQKKQIAYDFNSQIGEILERMLSYSFVVRTDSHSIEETVQALLECLGELSPNIISEELFNLALSERIEAFEQENSLFSTINFLLKSTFDRSFDYNSRKEILQDLRSLSYQQFRVWLSTSLNCAPILIIACMSENTPKVIKRKTRKFVPDGFTKIKAPGSLFEVPQVKAFYFHNRIFN